MNDDSNAPKDTRDVPEWVRASRDRWRSRFFTTWAVIGLFIVLYFTGVVIGRIQAAIWPFVVAFLIVFLLKGPVSGIAKRFNLHRGAATGIVYLMMAVVLGFVGSILVPLLVVQLVSFAKAATNLVETTPAWLQHIELNVDLTRFPSWLTSALGSVMSSVGTFLSSLGKGIAEFVIATGQGVAAGAADLLLGLLLAFWILMDLPKMLEVAEELAGPAYGDDLDQLITTVNAAVGGYLRGQGIASLSTGFMAFVGLAVLGVPYSFMLGVVAFFLNFIPYVGPFATGLIAGVVAFFAPHHGIFGLHLAPWIHALLAVGAVVLAQQLTDNLITPRVMSEQVDLHPTLVIFSLLVGGTLFGFAGLLFAIPVAATAKGLFTYYWDRREHHPLSGPSPLVVADDSDGEPEA